MRHRTSFLIGYKIGQLFVEVTIKPMMILIILCSALAQIIEVITLEVPNADDPPSKGS